MTRTEKKLRRDAKLIIEAALQAADAGSAVKTNLRLEGGFLRVGHLSVDLRDFDRVFLIAVGKASVAMAAEVSRILRRSLSGGIVVTKHGHGGKLPKFLHQVEAAHPVPDQAGWAAAAELVALLRELNARDLLLVNISGGASALLPAPCSPITLEEKQKTTDLLLRAGADIFELNAVRKHLSFLKGGGLASLAYPATVVSLLLSDVIGDPVDVIGSGLTAPDPTTFETACEVLERYRLFRRVPTNVRKRMELGRAGVIADTPKPGDPAFQNVSNIVIGSNRLALKAAKAKAEALGYNALLLSSTIVGETREVAKVHAEILREVKAARSPTCPPACLLSGGETTVTVKGNGKGGRNQEFALASAASLDRLSGVLVAGIGTDGTDGPTDAAGAIATGDTGERARALGLSLYDHLTRNDAYPLFEALGDLVKTGPTGTNVMDIYLLLAR